MTARGAAGILLFTLGALAACSSDSSEGSGTGGASTGGSGGASASGGSGGADASSGGAGGASGGSGGSAGSAAGSGGASGGSAGVAGDAATGGSSGADAAADAAPAVGYCTRPCGTVNDCCPAGSTDCPSNQYPNNYKCVAGGCRSPECSTTTDCSSTNPKLDCFSLSGFHSCALTCSADTDCTSPLTCSGLDDNNKKFCLAKGSGCSDDASCNGYGKCVEKVCVCYADADCTKAGFTKCAL
ncbi:MAG: hypothetical protein IPM35_10920 [Myxococcales bacterium]|nr:hypothetical protein [Myxococcales bacterium]